MEGVFYLKTEEEMIATYGPAFKREYSLGWDHAGMTELLGLDITETISNQIESKGEFIEDWESQDGMDTFYFGGYSWERDSIRINLGSVIPKMYNVQQNGLFTT